MIDSYLEYIQNTDTNKFKIAKSRIHGKGLIVTDHILKGEFIFLAMITIPSKLYVDDRQVTYFGSFMNHSYSPTAKMLEENGDYNVYALFNLKPGDEITIDYTTCDVIKQPKKGWK